MLVEQHLLLAEKRGDNDYYTPAKTSDYDYEKPTHQSCDKAYYTPQKKTWVDAHIDGTQWTDRQWREWEEERRTWREEQRKRTCPSPTATTRSGVPRTWAGPSKQTKKLPLGSAAEAARRVAEQ